MARILVIDDEEAIRLTFEAFLTRAGHDVWLASTYEEALDALDAARPDLCFIDILLGAHSGLELLEAVRARDEAAQVILITGEPSLESAVEGMRLNADDYLQKPITKDNLLHVTARTLHVKQMADDRRRLRREKDALRLRLEAVFQSVSEAIVTVDAEGRILQANRAARTVLGIDHTAIEGESCKETLGELHGSFCHLVEQTMERRQPVKEFRVEFTDSEGKRRVAVLDASPLRSAADAEETFQGVVLVIRDITRLTSLEQELRGRRSYGRMVGKSQPMQEVYALLEELSRTDTTVLVTGESGTGKELVAEALHYSGARAENALVKVNCSALSENLLESELFGHVRGAFTGALRDKVGRFKLAHGGTIFLDEIGDVSPRIQLKLLRVLQEKEFERVGDVNTIKVDVRVIAATNQDLRAKVRAGEFREDLYYRLKVVEVQLPPVRERRGDIPLLLEHFREYFNGEMERSVASFTEDARAALMRHQWPGNVRELRHAVEHAFILCRGADIEPRHLPVEIIQPYSTPFAHEASPVMLDREGLIETLKRAGGNKAQAARMLGVSRQTVYRKLKEFDIA